MHITRLLTGAVTVLGVLALTACSAGPGFTGSAEADTSSGTVTIGYFPNVTHAPAIVGLADGEYRRALGRGVIIKTATFNSGTEEVEALFAGSVDIGFIGPSPTVTAWQKSDGRALKVIAGAAADGVDLVVRAGIHSAAELKGKTIATPSLGNTQDVAARSWLRGHGFTTDAQGGGDVHIEPQDNASALTALQTGAIDGAWVPEPWATRMVDEAGAHVLVDEADLWPGRLFVTTNVVVRTDFLAQHPKEVEAFLRGLLATMDAMKKDPAAAQQTVATQIGALSGSTPKPSELASSWKNVVFTPDPLAGTLAVQAQHATALGLLPKTDLAGLYDLAPLNALLTARGDRPVAGR